VRWPTLFGRLRIYSWKVIGGRQYVSTALAIKKRAEENNIDFFYRPNQVVDSYEPIKDNRL
jgi:hypothetical protein